MLSIPQQKVEKKQNIGLIVRINQLTMGGGRSRPVPRKNDKLTLLALGLPATGKSYLLNLLAGQSPDKTPENEQLFKSGGGMMHITEHTEARSCKLFGEGQEVVLIDTKGLDHSLESTNTRMFLFEIEQFLKNNYNSTINYILYCFNVTNRWTRNDEDLMSIIKHFLPTNDTRRVIFFMTRCDNAGSKDLAKTEAHIKALPIMKDNLVELVRVKTVMEADVKSKMMALFEARKTEMSITLKTFQELESSIKRDITERLARLSGNGCFSGRSVVQMADGSVKNMKDLAIGDELLTADNGIIRKARVCCFLHYEPETIATFLQFRLKNGTVLEITHEHMVAAYPKKERLPTFILARNAAVGDCLVEYQNGLTKYEEIVEIASVEEKGVYAPLSTTGTLIVNSCLTSCYAIFESQLLCHLAMLPLITYASVYQVRPSVGIHPYCRALKKMLPLLHGEK